MHILCPHCRNPVEIVKLTSREEIACPSCGSSFRLEGESTSGWQPGGDKFGKFELIGTVGQGAFGTVYKARDPGLDRTVAVKVPRAGNLAGPQELDRFVREARSVAQLRHPAIVSVHEVGQSDGVPYLVSDFVQGVTLTDLLSARRPAFREAAELVAAVADALQYAHEHGVVHRDVKPSNIMIGEDGRPCVMDFGLAKRDAGEITMTVEGQVLGTPAYMSPEQAKGEAHRVDGRSDVYSLGVVFYQLLTGELPFRGTSRMLLHQVLHDEPRPPRTLNERIPRDLQTICLKAMAKEPRRRYTAARDFADDLRRFLKGEPILARPVGSLERLGRWCRRNPVVAGLSAAVLVLLVAVAAGSLAVAWHIASINKDLTDAREAADREAAAAVEQRDRAQANLDKAKEAVDECFSAASENPLLQGDNLQPVRQLLLRAALKYYRHFVDQRNDDPETRAELARNYYRVGIITEEIGSKTEALRAFEQARDIREELVRSHPGVAAHLADLSSAYGWIGGLKRELGDLPGARKAQARARALIEQTLGAHPDRAEYVNDLARVVNNMSLLERHAGDMPAALRLVAEARELRQKLAAREPANAEYQNALAVVLNRQANYQRLTGDPAASLRSLQDAHAVRAKLAEAHPDSAEYQRNLGESHHNLGLLLRETGDVPVALKSYEEARKIRARLAAANPAVVQYQTDLALTLNNLGNLQRSVGDHAGALESLGQARRVREQVVKANPAVPDYQSALATTVYNLGVAHRAAGDVEAAVRCYGEARVLQEKLVETYPDQPAYRSELGGTLFNLANALRGRERNEEAAPLFRQAVEYQRQALERSPRTASYRQALSSSLSNLASCLRDLNRPAEAAEVTLERRKLWPKAANELVEAAAELAVCVSLSEKAGRADEAAKYTDLAIQTLRQAVAAGLKDAGKVRSYPELAPLRNRPDFQKLLDELQQANPQGK